MYPDSASWRKKHGLPLYMLEVHFGSKRRRQAMRGERLPNGMPSA